MQDHRRNIAVLAIMGSLLCSDAALADEEKDLCDGQVSPKLPGGTDEGDRQWALYQALCNKSIMSKGPGRNKNWDLIYLMDRPGKPFSEIVRANQVYQCLHADPSESAAKAAYALCGVDARRLDKAALDAEVSRLKLNALGKQRAEDLFSAAKKLADDNTAAMKRLGPSAQKLFFDAPEAAFTGWDKIYSASKAALDGAFAVEDKARAIAQDQRSQPQNIGCEDVRKSFQSYVAGKSPKSADDVRAAIMEPVGYLLLARLMTCDALEGRWVTAAVEHGLLELNAKSWAGPRYAAYWAVTDIFKDHASKLGIEEEDFAKGQNPNSWQPLYQVAREAYGDHVASFSMISEYADDKDAVAYNRRVKTGKIASIKKTKDGVLLSFKKEKWVEPVMTCVSTGRIGSWDIAGKPNYIMHCKQTGTSVEEFTMDPVVADEVSGAGLKVGQVVKLAIGETTPAKTPPPAFVFEVADGGGAKAQPKPIRAWGFLLR